MALLHVCVGLVNKHEAKAWCIAFSASLQGEVDQQQTAFATSLQLALCFANAGRGPRDQSSGARPSAVLLLAARTLNHTHN